MNEHTESINTGRVLAILRDARQRLEDMEKRQHEPIAIVGMACRLPVDIASPESFWSLLSNGGTAVRAIPNERLNEAYFPSAGPDERQSGWRAGMLEGVDRFDAAFFGISRREAASMDPQQRLLLEVSWEALENAGQRSDRLEHLHTGVYVGGMAGDYGELLSRVYDPYSEDVYHVTGTDLSSISGRISYLLGLHGPSMVVCAACASSLVTVHLACQALRTGECELALAGGVNLILTPTIFRYLSRMGALAPDGHCKTFDANANGYVRGEGCGIVVLKRLSDALADGERILALIRGSAVNHNGGGAGYTIPGVRGQRAVIEQAYANGEISPDAISYIEAHGTGTALGDPIEVSALSEVFGARSPENPLWIGSAKTNIGHLEPAAGIAGLIKTVLSLQNEAIPPLVNFTTKSPYIQWDRLNVCVPITLTPWPRGVRPRIAGVSAFSLMGTNAHVVVEESPEVPTHLEKPVCRQTRSSYILPVSAQSAEALTAMVRAYRKHLETEVDDNATALRDTCYSASVRRTHLKVRTAAVGASRAQMIESLKVLEGQRADPGTAIRTETRPRGMVLVFPGQGSQWLGMGRQLMLEEPVFRDAMELCDAAMQPYVGWSLVDEVKATEDRSRYGDIDVVQPVLCSLQIALAALWQSWGIRPDVVVGHSMGEVAAAYVAGALNIDDCMRIICRRSLLLRRVRGLGAMASVALSADQAHEAIRGYNEALTVAVCNSPQTTVVAGEPSALRDCIRQLEERSVFCAFVNIDVASHSPQVDALIPDLLAELHSLAPVDNSTAMLSTVSGEFVDGRSLDASYWAKNLRETVLFGNAIANLCKLGYRDYLEISAHPVLLPVIRQCLAEGDGEGNLYPSLRRNEDEGQCLATTLGRMYAQGHPVDWEGVYFDGGSFVQLPNYQWQRQPFWAHKSEACDRAGKKTRHDPAHGNGSGRPPFLLDLWQSSERPVTFVGEVEIDLAEFPYFQDHRVLENTILPATAVVEVALEMFATRGVPPEQIALSNLEFKRPIVLGNKPTRMRIVTTDGDAGTVWLKVLASNGDNGLSTWTEHVTGVVQLSTPVADELRCAKDLISVRRALSSPVDVNAFVEELGRRGLVFGPAFQGITAAWRRDGEALAQVESSNPDRLGTRNYVVHPAVLDACLQIAIAAFPLTQVLEDELYMPIGISRIVFDASNFASVEALWCHARVTSMQGEPATRLTVDVDITDPNGSWIARVTGLEFVAVGSELLRGVDHSIDHLCYSVHWEQCPARDEADTSGNAANLTQGSWLVFADRNGLGRSIAGQLRASGDSVVSITPGKAFARIAPFEYQIDPTNLCDFEQLIRALRESSVASITGVLHFWSLDAPDVSLEWESAWQQALDCGCLSILHLVKSLAIVDVDSPPRLWLVTRGAQPVAAAPCPVALLQTPVLGLGRVVALEQPELRCTCIDIGPEGEATSLDDLYAEIRRGGEADEVALRREGRFVRRLVRLEPGSSLPLIAADGTYLITGGFGGIGLQVAQWLARRGAGCIVLASRSTVDVSACEVTRALVEQGTKVQSRAVDISDAEQVRRLFAEIGRDLPPLRGVFHAAGVLDDGILLEQTPERFARVMAPKVQGSWNLYRHTRDQKLDYFVLFSSIASLIGSPGQANYAAANAFLDGFVHYLHAEGAAGLSINWGAWARVGLAAREARQARLTSRGMRPISPDAGIAALEWLLTSDNAQAAVAALDVERWRRSYLGAARSRMFDRIAALGAECALTSGEVRVDGNQLPELQIADPEERLLRVTHSIRREVANVFLCDEARLENSRLLRELGMDSLMAVELLQRLSTAFGIAIPVRSLIMNGTISGLANEVLSHIEEWPQPRAVPSSSGELSSVRDTAEPAEEAQATAILLPTTTNVATGSPGGWLVRHSSPANAQITLFCFAYAGGGAPVFARWPELLADSVEVIAVELPGRGARLGEEPLRRIDEIVEQLVPVLHQSIDKPYAFFGHCLGAILMYEIARRLQAETGSRPLCLFASGASAPHLYLTPPLFGQPTEKFLEALRLVNFHNMAAIARNEELLALMLPTIRADFEAAAYYHFSPKGALTCPIIALGAWNDQVAPKTAIEAWKEHTTSEFRLIMYPGGHYFIESQRPSILENIAQELDDLLNAQASGLLKSDTLPSAHENRGTQEVWGLRQREVICQRHPQLSHGRGRWLTSPEPRHTVRGRLICYPFAAGRPEIFDSWSRHMPHDVELITICPPGRSRRRSERPHSSVGEIVEELVQEIQPLLDRPFALFGHDLGAITMFELARRLKAACGVVPATLFVSAAVAPPLYYFSPIHCYPRAMLVDMLRMFDFPLTGDIPSDEMMSMIRADFQAVAEYRYAPGDTLECPVTAFMAKDDAFVPQRGVEKWRDIAPAGFSLEEFDGHHYFLVTDPTAMAQRIARALRGMR